MAWLPAMLVSGLAEAEQGVLVVHVQGPHGKPLAEVVLATKGDGSTGPATDLAGKTRIRLAPATGVGSRVTLQIVRAPKDYVFISPWDAAANVPPFENEAENYVPVVLAERGDRMMLENGSALVALAAQINRANAPRAVGEKTTEQQRKEALAEVARSFGLAPEEVDKAIRAWGQRTEDPYEKGLAAWYERHYPEASDLLARSFRQRKAAAEKGARESEDAACFLGQALYEQPKYRESAEAYREALRYRPEDATVMNNLGLSLRQAGDYAGAEPLYRRALAIREKALGSEHPDVAQSLNNLAELLRAKGDCAGAEPLHRRALAIWEKVLGPEHPNVATSLNNLALLLKAKGDYAGAEPLHRRALAIFEKALGPEHPNVATGLNNLAGLLQAKADYAGAEPLFHRALAICEKALGPEHPSVAASLDNLAALLEARGDYAAAEPLYWRALAIDEKVLGSEHSDVATDLNNLAGLLWAKGNYARAEPLYRRALAI
jgi:tetratricopeptide (TPR) repeat protein